MQKKQIIFSLFFLFLWSFLFAKKTEFDSLQLRLKQTYADSSRARLLLKIGDIFEFSDTDSASFYYNKALQIARKSSDKFYEAKSLLYLGSLSDERGDFDKALNYYLQAVEIGKKENIRSIICSCYIHIGGIYYNQGDFPKALNFFQKALVDFEKLASDEAKNKVEKYARPDEGIKGICASYMNIGIIHYELKNNELALLYCNKSLKVYETFAKSSDPAKVLFGKAGIGRCYNNMGNVYLTMFKYPEAIEFYNKSLEIKKELNDKRGMSLCYNNIGNVYSELGDYAMAIEPYQIAIKLYDETEDKNGQALVLANVAGLNIMLADSVAKSPAERKKFFMQAIKNGKKSFDLAKLINAIPIINEAAKNLRVAYRATGDLQKSIEYSEIYIATKDTMFKEEKTKAITEMEKKYESEKKQQEIEKQLLQLSKKDAEIKKQQAVSSRQKIIIGFVVCGLLFVIIVMFILYRMFVQKRKANIIILIKNKELEQANEEIRAQRDEIETQRNLVVKQKNELAIIYEEQTDSIIYAQRIQQAVFPMNEYLDRFLKNYFILNKPKNIVSGDFFWFTKVRFWSLFCVADCTGHGVPGAFMSMLGIALMNEIVRQEEISKASHVLDQLRKRVIESLKQRGLKGEQQDGMDMSFVALNTETFELQFAGANNPCWIVSGFKSEVLSFDNAEETNFKQETLNIKLHEVKPDKQPIGIHSNMQPFANQILQLQKGDIIYLMSDGYEDQFGGPNRKKFMAKNLKNLLIANSQQPMAEQKQILETTLINWIGETEQIDDITVLGIKI